jgi:hypothetical protein
MRYFLLLTLFQQERQHTYFDPEGSLAASLYLPLYKLQLKLIQYRNFVLFWQLFEIPNQNELEK